MQKYLIKHICKSIYAFEQADRSYMDITKKNVLVFGTGLSGIAAVKLLHRADADILLYDSNESVDVGKLREKLPKDFKGEILLGNLEEQVIDTLDLVVLSPGVATDLVIVNTIREKQIPIWGEIELAYQFSKGKIAGITGTNGKTTTTTLVGEILKRFYESVFVVGNIGVPFTEVVTQTLETSVTVAELSSFQLETIHSFQADVSAILNITPDHLNRHHTMENYINAKANICINQGEDHTCVLNYEDDALRELGKKLHAKVLYFSSKRPLEDGLYLQDNTIYYSKKGEKTVICHTSELHIFGVHSYENVMAAVAIALVLEVPMELIQEGIKKFTAVEHRIEFVTTKGGVTYYNDSKGTNTDASIKAIEAMRTPTLLIAGGYDKEADFDEWIKSFGSKIKLLVLLGQTKEKIAAAAKKNGYTNIIMAESLEEAVLICSEQAKAGDAVLLSPACASWGMFTNYEERGRLFKEYVRKLPE